MIEELEIPQRAPAASKTTLIAFCRHMQKDYKVGAHHKRLAALLEDIERGYRDRICVSVPPRATASRSLSPYTMRHGIWAGTPAIRSCWCRTPRIWRLILVGKVRNLIDTAEFKEVFPNVALASDSKSAGRWNTNLRR
jgi:hypothetical protein